MSPLLALALGALVALAIVWSGAGGLLVIALVCAGLILVAVAYERLEDWLAERWRRR